jgi:hypothetical protein
MTAPNISDYQWLTSAEGIAALADLMRQANAKGEADVSIVSRLRKAQPAERVHLLLEQVELRRRAAEKFPDAAKLFFTRKGLEQATDEWLAAYKARRFPARRLVADFCCGIGGDLCAVAARGPIVGYDADEVTTHFARANLQARDLDPQSVRCERAIADNVRDASAWHIDPDRRPAGQRVIELADYEPGPDFLSAALAANPHGAVKIAPAAQVNAADWPPCEREWLESRGECRQQVLWFGGLALNVGLHVATEVSASRQCHSFSGQADLPFAYATEVADFVYEPSPSILAGRLAGAFAQAHQLLAITPGGGYLTADHLLERPLVNAFRVRDVLPFDLKKLRAYCRQHQLGQLEIKKRGVDLDPARVRKEIIVKGEGRSVILIAPLAGSVKAIVADRV